MGGPALASPAMVANALLLISSLFRIPKQQTAFSSAGPKLLAKPTSTLAIVLVSIRFTRTAKSSLTYVQTRSAGRSRMLAVAEETAVSRCNFDSKFDLLSYYNMLDCLFRLVRTTILT